MRRVLTVGLTMVMAAAVVTPALGAKAKPPLKATSNGWYVFDGVEPTTKTPKNGTNTRCVNDPNTPPVIALGARFGIKNRSAPASRKYILNGPGGIHIVAGATSSLKPGNYYRRFRASAAGQSSFGPGKYTFKLKKSGSGPTLTSETITLVDDPNC